MYALLALPPAYWLRSILLQSVQSFRWPGARELNYNCIDGSLMLRADVLGIAADARFQNTGLERSAALSEDITWMQQEYGLSPVELSEDGPGRAYSRCHSVFPESSSSSSILSPLTSYHTRMLQAHNLAMSTRTCFVQFAEGASARQPTKVPVPLLQCLLRAHCWRQNDWHQGRLHDP